MFSECRVVLMEVSFPRMTWELGDEGFYGVFTEDLDPFTAGFSSTKSVIEKKSSSSVEGSFSSSSFSLASLSFRSNSTSRSEYFVFSFAPAS